MITTTPAFDAQFEAAQAEPVVEIGLIAQSNFNFPEDSAPTASASSSKGSRFGPEYAIDGETIEPMKYWLLGRGCKIGINPATGLTHGWRLLGPKSLHNPGWWSSNKSDASGNFSAPYPYHETVYSTPIDCNLVRVITTSVYTGNKEFVLKVWYAGAGSYTTIGTYTLAAGEISKTAALGEVKSVSKIKVEITKTQAATQNAKLVEVEPVLEFSPATTPATDYVMDCSWEKSSGDTSPGKPAAPGVGANSLSLTFSRDIASLAAPAENMIITLKAGYAGDLLGQGNYIVLEPPEETLDGYSVRAYSSLQMAKYYSLSDLIFQNQKTSSILSYILGSLGISPDKISFSLASDATWTWYILESGDIASLLSTVCDHFGVAIYQLEDGTVKVRSSYGASAVTLDDDIISSLSVQSAKTINCVEVHYAIVRQEAEDEIWSLDNEITVPASSSVNYVFPISKSPATNIKSPHLTDAAAAVAGDLSITAWRCNGFYLNLTITNSAGTAKAMPQGGISMRGRPLSLSTERVYEARNESSIKRLGRREFPTSLYCASDSVAQGVANRMLTYLNKAAEVYQVTLNRPMPQLQVRDVATLSSTVFGISKDVVVTRIGNDRGSVSIDCISKAAVT